ncbi:alpha/beta hydrolase [Pusillimonas sp. SM2304]|uniref:alpha/beta fold hydrolase n=1 Tax=Pusillimonas sp. SM2304 TaxID=3073241 RepID=UPI002875FF44|nr:alpha/beta hydrolase [Pusillimonas sp. SM2304]MDS1139887.1 alpha/beta hydrolase [Pusillimonas sp. SM2304]
MAPVQSEVKALGGLARALATGRSKEESIVWRVWECGSQRPGRVAPVIVLLHGSYGSWTHWLRNVPAWSETCTVVAVDMPGFGESGNAPAQRMPPDMGRALGEGWLALQDRLPVLAVQGAPLFLAGFSLGGIYAGWMLRYLMRADSGIKRRPAGLLLFGPGGLGHRPGLDFGLKPVSQRHQSPMERAAAHRHNLEVLMFARAENIDDQAVAIQDENVASARFRGPFTAHPSSLLDALEGVDLPLLGVWGGRDAFDADVRTRIAALRAVAPQMESVVVPDAGHWVIYECARCVNAAAMEWINKISP